MGKGSTSISSSGASTNSTEESTKVKLEGKVFKCYGCGKTGHKKPDCSNKKKASVVKLGSSRTLRRNEMLATVGGISMPVTLNTGAEVSVLPMEAECVKRYTGETVTLGGVFDNATSRQAPLAEAELIIGGETVNTIAAMVEGQYINWKGALAFDTDDEKALELFGRLNRIRANNYKGDRKYSPVIVMGTGHIQGVVMWADIPKEVIQQENMSDIPVAQGGARLRVLTCEADGTQVIPSRNPSVTTPVLAVSQSEGKETHSEEIDGGVSQQIPDSGEDSAEETSVGSKDEVLVDDDVAYVEEEEKGVQGDSAGRVEEGNSVETLEVTMNESLDELVKALQEDYSLDSIKKLAERGERL